MRCQACGTEARSERARFCGNCGAPLQAAPPPTDPASSETVILRMPVVAPPDPPTLIPTAPVKPAPSPIPPPEPSPPTTEPVDNLPPPVAPVESASTPAAPSWTAPGPAAPSWAAPVPATPSGSTVKLWTPRVIGGVSVLSMFLSGVILAAINWWRIGQRPKASLAMVAGVIATMIFVPIVVLLTGNGSHWVGLGVNVGMGVLLRRMMERDRAAFAVRGGLIQDASWRWGALVAVGVTVFVLAYAGVVLLGAAAAQTDWGTLLSNKATIERVELAHGVEDGKAVSVTTTFAPKDVIYCVVTLGSNPPADTRVKFAWTAIEASGGVRDQSINENELALSGRQNVAYSNLTPTASGGLPTGRYQVQVFLNDAPSRVIEFTVQ